jgi:methyl-accepting chemotaxis protein
MGRLSLRMKIIAGLLAVSLLLEATTLLLVFFRLSAMLEEESVVYGAAIARDVAANSALLIPVDDVYGLNRLVKDTIGNNPDVRYLIVLDVNGQPLADSFPLGVPQDLLKANTYVTGQRYSLATLQTSEGVIRDVAVPMADGQLGTVRVGLSNARQSANLYGTTFWIALITTALLILISGGLYAASHFLIVRPISAMQDLVQAANQGDLTRRAAVYSQDELGVLANAFNNMVARLHGMLQAEQDQRQYLQDTIQTYAHHLSRVAHGDLATRLSLDGRERGADDPLIILGQGLNEMTGGLHGMVAQMRDVANALSSSAAEILAATTQQASGASEQSAAIAQTSTTVDEVKTISGHSMTRAQEVVGASQRTVDVARGGQRSVQDTIDSMMQIKERVEDIAENILALSEQTQQIGEIIATVNEIAAQSNMLALNASVEAARAGEHGKGFAVVAVEVRNLAEQSKQATAQVKAILSEIQKATNATVMATEEGTKGVDAGVQLAAQARASIEQLAAVISESAQAAVQMVAGGQQQTSGVEQIALAMQNINQATVQNLASTRQTERAAQNLNELARQLTATIAQYQLN